MKERIVFLALAAAILIGAFALTSQTDEGRGDVITLAVATDLHYLAPELTDHGEFFTELITDADGKAMEYIDELVRAFAAEIAGAKPDALILSGDLTFNGETASHEALADILSGIENAGVPVYVIPGNHDMNNSMAVGFVGDSYELAGSPTEGEFARIYARFGYDEAISRDAGSLSYSVLLDGGVRLVFLDVNTSSTPGWALDSTLDWLEGQLSEARSNGERIVAVSHQNLYAHNPLLSDGYVIGNGGRILELYDEYGVLCNLSGHIHLQRTAAATVPEIVTSSLAVSPNQYGLLSLRESSASYETVPVDVEAWARGQGYENGDLLDFTEYSSGFFRDTAVRQAMEALDGYEGAQALADFYADVNALYFAGRTDLIEWDDGLMEDWQGRSFFIPLYLESIRAGGADNHTVMTVA